MVDVSVVVPVKDEAGNAGPLAREIVQAMAALRPPVSYEAIFVDDGSNDGTVGELLSLRPEIGHLRILLHGRCLGQSRAIRTGVKAAAGALIVTLDGDGQNDPADIEKVLTPFADAPDSLGLVAGERAGRKDGWSKRAASKIANRIRSRMLGDKASDTGCGLKAFRREAFLALPYFDHMHRYLIALMRREGYDVHFARVGHRARRSGRSKYGNWDRFAVGISDLMGMLWLKRRFGGPSETREI